MTDETRDERHDLPTRRAIGEAINALSAALTAAAATVVVLAWIESWEDVSRLSRTHYLFWPLAVAAATLHIQARRIRPSDQREIEGSTTEHS